MFQASRAFFVTALGLVALLAIPVRADSGLLKDSLGRWLDNTAAPKLAEILSRHPKFKGETVRFISLHNGQRAASGNLLTQAMQQRLTQQLLRSDGVRLVWQDPARTCSAPQSIPYLLGLEVRRNGSREHQLNIAMIDVDEGVWVSGVSLSWEGRLSSAERQALSSRVASGPPGSTENPLSVREGTQISEIMRSGLRCSLPGGLDGPLYITAPTRVELAAIAQSLSRALSVTPLAVITVDREAAEWVMEIQARNVGTAGQELVVTLHDTTSDGVVQQVASVFVTGLDLAVAPDPLNMVAAGPAATIAPELLTQLTLSAASRNGICASSKAQANGCVEVGFELLRPAYLLVMSTQGQQLRSQTCGNELRLAKAGERRYRLRISPTQQLATQPDAGFYVMAVRARTVAQQIARHLNRGPGACSSVRDERSLATWLRGLDDLLRLHEFEIDWRATHLNHSVSGIVRL
ncbi:MAG: hypothetical protein O7B25_11650 [Gammaproteobacteria bacterium]|nr:hypothetical protein [Gammaproteobacteria bacterium]